MSIWFLYKTPIRLGRQVKTHAANKTCAVLAALYAASAARCGEGVPEGVTRGALDRAGQAASACWRQ